MYDSSGNDYEVFLKVCDMNNDHIKTGLMKNVTINSI